MDTQVIDKQILAIKAYLCMRIYKVVSEHTFARLDEVIDELNEMAWERDIIKAR